MTQLPLIDPTTIFKTKRLEVEPIDLSKALKRPKVFSSQDQPIDYSLSKKTTDVSIQHVSHVFAEKIVTKTNEFLIEEHNDETIEEDSDPEDENDDEKTFESTRNKELEEHRPLTPISSLSSSPSTIPMNEKKTSMIDVPPTPASTIRTRDRYSCTYCSKTFPRSANLTRHLRTHTDKFNFLSLIFSDLYQLLFLFTRTAVRL